MWGRPGTCWPRVTVSPSHRRARCTSRCTAWWRGFQAREPRGHDCAWSPYGSNTRPHRAQRPPRSGNRSLHRTNAAYSTSKSEVPCSAGGTESHNEAQGPPQFISRTQSQAGRSARNRAACASSRARDKRRCTLGSPSGVQATAAQSTTGPGCTPASAVQRCSAQRTRAISPPVSTAEPRFTSSPSNRCTRGNNKAHDPRNAAGPNYHRQRPEPHAPRRLPCSRTNARPHRQRQGWPSK